MDFGWARICEETRYPFDGKVVFRFSMDEPADQSFSYRVPGWCRKGAQVKINGEATAACRPGAFATIRRTFADGDMIELAFPMETVFEVLPRRHYVIKDAVSKWVGKIEGRSISQGTVVRRGPLLFAYPIPAEKTEDCVEHANMRGKKSANSEFKCWNMRPAGPFNYAIVAHRAEMVGVTDAIKSAHPVSSDGFLAHPDAVKLRIPVRRIVWDIVDDRFTPDMPETPVPVSDEVETIELVPYGATMLRLAVFPDIGRL